MRVTMALFCTALIAAAVSAQTVPVADIPVTFDPAAKVRVLATALDDPADYDPERAGPKYDPKAYSAENLAKMQNMGRPNPQIWVRTMAGVASSRSRWAMGRTRSSMTASGCSSRAAPNGRRRGR